MVHPQVVWESTRHGKLATRSVGQIYLIGGKDYGGIIYLANYTTVKNVCRLILPTGPRAPFEFRRNSRRASPVKEM